jgi:hypothetical protein
MKIHTFYLKGGLGNQIFQLNKILSLKENFDLDSVIINIALLDSYSTSREFELAKYFDLDKEGVVVNSSPVYFKNIYKVILRIVSNFDIFPVYFSYYQNTIISLEEVDKLLHCYRSNIRKTLSDEVLIHARLGDYLQVIPEYRILLIDFINKFTEKYTSDEYLVSTDDIDYFKSDILPFLNISNVRYFDLDFNNIYTFKCVFSPNSSYSFWYAAMGRSKLAMPEDDFGFREYMLQDADLIH